MPKLSIPKPKGVSSRLTVNRLPTSFRKFNYALRPNKALERKLMFRALGQCISPNEASEFHYVGFGSMWFVDFHFAHKQLGIRSLTSIEGGDPDRAHFNKPYACIEVKHGMSSEVLPELDLRGRRSIIWLDYESALNQEILSDLALIGRSASSGSFLFVTIDADDKHFAPDTESIPKRTQKLKEAFGRYLDMDDLAANDIFDRLEVVFRDVVVRSLKEAVAEREDHNSTSVTLLMFVTYKDGAKMMTIGVYIGSNEKGKSCKGCFEEIGLQSAEGKQIHLAVPPLTLKEKAALDAQMPNSDPDIPQQIGFYLSKEEWDSYRKFYANYPVFSEIIS